MKYSIEYVTCVICKKQICGHIPKGGDGSVIFPYRHKVNITGLSWDGKPRKEYCPGSTLPCLEDTPDWKKYDMFADKKE